MQLRHDSRSRGFTLVELMISIVIGMIVISAVLGLVFANLQNTTTVTRGIRATQESRALTQILTRELLRSGYDGNGMTKIGSGSNPSTFNSITITAGPSCPNSGTNCCIKYAYDANGDGVAGTGEFRMFSRDVSNGHGVVRYGQFDSTGAVDCAGGSIITSDDINVRDFRFRKATAGTTAITSASDDACFVPKPSPAVTLPNIPVGDIYFAMNMSTTLDRNGSSSRRTDGVVTLR
jgi:Tfp pilus assembly protein PilW